jgi:gliding motility-associated-like protein
MVGDGFGGRLWYKPYNYTAGAYCAYTVCGPERSLYGWGTGPFGDGGNQTPPNGIHKAVGLDSVAFYTTGYNMACIRSDKSGWYWDDFFSFQSVFPKRVIEDVRFADAAINKVAFIKSDSTVWTMGSNADGSFGTNSTNYTYFDSVPLKMLNMNNAVRVAVSTNSIITLTSLGTVFTTGHRNNDFTVIDSNCLQVPVLQNIVDIKANSQSYLALDNNGDVWAWGYGAYGSLGLGYDSILATPQKIPTISNIIAISGSCDGFHFLALDKDSNCYSWGGYNSAGSCGTGTDVDIYIPTLVASNVADIMAGETFSYIVKTDGSLWGTGSSAGTNSIWLNLSDTPRFVFTKMEPTFAPFNLCEPVEQFTSKIQLSQQSICAGNTINFELKDANPATTYQWTFAGGTPSTSTAAKPSVLYSTSGVFDVLLIANTNGQIDSLRTIVNILPTPDAQIAGKDVVCIGDAVTLSSVNTAQSYLWSTGATSNSISVSPTVTSTYGLLLTNGNCKDSAFKTITTAEYPIAEIVGDNYLSCEEPSVTLNSVYTAQKYNWSSGQTTQSISVAPSALTTYTLTLSNADCAAEDTFTVDVDPNCDLIFPNAFTPNGEGGNEAFLASNRSLVVLQQYELMVYNRYGEQVFQSNDVNAGWNGALCDVGTYYYVCRYIRAGNKQKVIKGDITLLR